MIKLKNKIKLVISIGFVILFASNQLGFCDSAVMQDDEANSTTLIKAGVSVVDNVPTGFYGMWRVNATLSDTSASDLFRTSSVDIWNLSRTGDVINLTNPATGAFASITLDYVDSNIIKFTKTTGEDNQKLVDVVEIKLEDDNFTGINRLTLQTLSDIDNSVIKEDYGIFMLKGEKISGKNILKNGDK
ncbi:MAG: hypothetical protein R3Y28_04345 [Candidatus Gastranaerophilales bacterium]